MSVDDRAPLPAVVVGDLCDDIQSWSELCNDPIRHNESRRSMIVALGGVNQANLGVFLLAKRLYGGLGYQGQKTICLRA